MGRKTGKRPGPPPGGRSGSRTGKNDEMLDQLDEEIHEWRDQEQFDRGAADYQKQVKKYLDKKFTKYTRSLRNIINNRDGVPVFYYTAPLVKRRTAAALKYLPEAVSRFSSKYPSLNMEHEFAEICSTPCGQNYDMLELSSYISVAAAIFILDELTQSSLLRYALLYFPRREEFEFETALPDNFHDCQYDDLLISSLAWLIQERYAGEKDFDPDRIFINHASQRRTEADFDAAVLPKDAPDENVLEYSNRQRLDAILSFIRPAVAKRAAKRFEEKIWEFFDRILECINPFRVELVAECDRLLRLTKELQRIKEERRQAKAAPLLKQPPDFSSTPDGLLDECLNFHIPDHLWNLAEEASQKRETCSSLNRKQGLLRLMCTQAVNGDKEFTGESIDKESMELLTSFTVDNPYETCFALLWLLDSGSDLPWLITLGCGVVCAAKQQLPWTGSDNPALEEDDEEADGSGDISPKDGKDGVEEERTEMDDLDGDAFLRMMKESEPVDWIGKEAELYRRKYTDAAMWMDPENVPEDKLYQWNLPQLVYAYTGLTMPRRLNRFDETWMDLEKSGVAPELGRALELYLELADSRKLRYDKISELIPQPSEEADGGGWENEPEEAWDEGRTDASELQEQVRSLKDEVRRLKGALSDADRKAAAERENAAQAAANHEAEHRELIELRELVYRLSNGGQDDETMLPEPVAFPYTAKQRMVVFGGHATWLKAIQPMLPNVRFVPLEMIPNANMIRHADMVWVQTNAIAHKNFNKITDVVRTYKIPLRYFGYASAEKCARQLAAEDLK